MGRVHHRVVLGSGAVIEVQQRPHMVEELARQGPFGQRVQRPHLRVIAVLPAVSLMCAPSCESIGVLHEPRAVGCAVVEVGPPLECVERADIDADAAVHAQPEVDLKPSSTLTHLGRLAPGSVTCSTWLSRLMHHVGHSRTQSMHEVQASGTSAITPRASGGRSCQ